MVEITRLNVTPAYQVVSHELQRLILSGELQPGEQLPGEVELASKFGVNRSTVREGIRHLESEGLLRREGRKRLLIAIPGQGHMSERMERALLLHDVKFHELWELARVLEPLSASLAARHATDEQIAALEANVTAMAERVAQGEPLEDLDTAFHDLLCTASANRALILSRDPIGQLLFRPYVEVVRVIGRAAQRNLDAHRAIFAAVAKRDEATAADWMARHIDDLKRGWLLAGRSLDDSIAAG